MENSRNRAIRVLLASSLVMMLLLLGPSSGSAQSDRDDQPQVSIAENAVVQTRPIAPRPGTTVVAPLGPLAPSPRAGASSSGPAATLYVILIVTIPLVTVATIVAMQSKTRRRLLGAE